MASQTFPLRALVLRRTKLGETDVICTFLAKDGSQVRAVAKGARKPTSSFSSRLETYCVCDLLLVRGKSLDIVKEVRLVSANEHLRGNFDLMSAAAPMVELMDRCTQAGLEDPRLYAMTVKALMLLEGADLPCATLLCCAHLLKSCAVLGFRPHFGSCVLCGRELDACAASRVSFSYFEGGVVCGSCAPTCETTVVPSAVASWGQALLYATFEEVFNMECEAAATRDVIAFLRQWIAQHIGTRLKSLELLAR